MKRMKTKKALLYLLPAACLLLVHCSEPTQEEIVRRYESGQTRKVHITTTSGPAKEVVKIITYHENGKKKSETEYRNGQAHGLEIMWHENGQKKSETEFKKGTKHGDETGWFDDGEMKMKRRFKEGKKHGRETIWYYPYFEAPSGRLERSDKLILRSRIDYKNGKKHGKERLFDFDGKLESQNTWKNGNLVLRKSKKRPASPLPNQ